MKGQLRPEEALHRETAGLVIVRQHKEAIKKLISNQLISTESTAPARNTISVVDFTELYEEKRLFSVTGSRTANLRNAIAELMIESV